MPTQGHDNVFWKDIMINQSRKFCTNRCGNLAELSVCLTPDRLASASRTNSVHHNSQNVQNQWHSLEINDALQNKSTLKSLSHQNGTVTHSTSVEVWSLVRSSVSIRFQFESDTSSKLSCMHAWGISDNQTSEVTYSLYLNNESFDSSLYLEGRPTSQESALFSLEQSPVLLLWFPKTRRMTLEWIPLFSFKQALGHEQSAIRLSLSPCRSPPPPLLQ